MATNQSSYVRDIRIRRGLVFGVIIVTALLAFEIFNYSTTDYALSDLLGDLKFMGLRWSTILAIAFCGIDFAGIARLFSPSEHEPGTPVAHNENWYLFGAWLLAATMNAMLTWWGVALAVMGHQTLGNEVVGRETLLNVVPVFVAVLVWLIRVLIIGTFSVSGERLFGQDAIPAAAPARPMSTQRIQTAPQPRQAPVSNPTGQRGQVPMPLAASQPKNTSYRSMHTAGSNRSGQPAKFDSARPETVRIDPPEPEEATYIDVAGNGHTGSIRTGNTGPVAPNRTNYTRNNNNSRQFPR